MLNYFPTDWQKVLFRNYGLVSNESIAKTLNMSEQAVVAEAENLGLKGVEYNSDWLKKGFVTLIRNNWDILPDEQIILLLNMDMAEYRKLLIEYDFLDVKVGKKPPLSTVEYSPLTNEQQAETKKIRALVEGAFVPETVKPFDFFNGNGEIVSPTIENCSITERFLAHYCADYGSALTDDELKDYSDEYLEKIASTGVNGLWLHESLKNLSEFPFDTAQSKGYEQRLNNLKKLTERAKKHGVNIYLYLNEPRFQPAEFFEKYPELKGQECDGGFCLCTSAPQVQEYLYNAIKSLAQSVPLLKAIMTITMSENPTHCYSRSFGNRSMLATDCPRCKDRKPEEVAAEVNNIIARALKDGNGYTKLIANLWSWSDLWDWTDEMLFHGVELLDKDIEILCVSEFSKNFKRGGVEAKLADYSISVIGPSDITVKTLKYAKKLGHKIWAKIQVNTSWECGGVPYVPAFDRMVKHIENLKKLGVSGLMMGWSLGGYPGGALSLCTWACQNGKMKQKPWYDLTYGDNSKLARKAVKDFSKAYAEFPFSIDVLYYAGHNLSCGNFYNLDADNRESTMVCYTFDDYEMWTKPYGIDVYISQMEKLTSKWQKGLELINKINGNANFEELKRVAQGVYIHMFSALNTAKFAKYKRDLVNNKNVIIAICKAEYANAKKLYELMATDAKIGYEVTNHYFANRQRVLEKLININAILEKLK